MEQQATYEVQEKKAPMDIDISKGILPKSYNELLQFAALYHGSGLAPKSFQTVQQCAIAIGMCLELDRPILTGIQDMAVINGKVNIYGDAALAIVRRSGLLEFIKETEEGTPYKDDWKFTCTIKRKGSPDPRTGIWTWEDAKRAGFDDPKMRDGTKDPYSPWRRFTRRMMQFKARNFVLRDEFGDVIKGMTLAEDANDAIIDVTPVKPQSTGLPKTETNGDPAIGAKVYEFKEAGPENPPPPTVEEQKPHTGIVDFGTGEDAEKKVEPPKVDPKKEMAALVLAEIKAAKPKTSDKAKKAFKDLYINNRDLILSLQGAEFDYVQGKFVNAGLSWGDDFLEPAGVRLPDPAQAATSSKGEANGSGQGEKTQGPTPAANGNAENKGEPKEEWLIKAEQCRDRILELGPEGEAVWHSILKLYSMIGKELKTLQPGYRDAFIKRAQGQLDLEIQKKDAKVK